MATTVLGLKTFAASDPVDYNEINDNYNKIDSGVKTALQGRAAHNLLDNSDFCIAQAGYGGFHGNIKYAADRWNMIASVSGVTKKSDQITITTTSDYGGIYQTVKVDEMGDGDTFTFAFRYKASGGAFIKVSRRQADGSYLSDVKGTWFDESANAFGLALITITRDEISTSDVLIFHIQKTSTGVMTIKHPRLYEGSYTAETLPAYQPKRYAAELAECQRYYWQYWQNNNMSAGNGYMNTTDTANITFEFPTKMRVAPTISIEDISTLRMMCVDGLKGVTAYSVVKSTYNQMMVGFTLNSASTQFTPCTMRSNGGAKIEFSADL